MSSPYPPSSATERHVVIRRKEQSVRRRVYWTNGKDRGSTPLLSHARNHNNIFGLAFSCPLPSSDYHHLFLYLRILFSELLRGCRTAACIDPSDRRTKLFGQLKNSFDRPLRIFKRFVIFLNFMFTGTLCCKFSIFPLYFERSNGIPANFISPSICKTVCRYIFMLIV